jgi:hypothetical protein
LDNRPRIKTNSSNNLSKQEVFSANLQQQIPRATQAVSLASPKQSPLRATVYCRLSVALLDDEH